MYHLLAEVASQNPNWIPIALAVLGTGAFTTIVNRLLGGKELKAGIKKITAETKKIEAETVDNIASTYGKLVDELVETLEREREERLASSLKAKEEIDRLITEVSLLRSQITTLETQISTLQEGIRTLSNQLEAEGIQPAFNVPMPPGL